MLNRRTLLLGSFPAFLGAVTSAADIESPQEYHLDRSLYEDAGRGYLRLLARITPQGYAYIRWTEQQAGDQIRCMYFKNDHLAGFEMYRVGPAGHTGPNRIAVQNYERFYFDEREGWLQTADVDTTQE